MQIIWKKWKNLQRQSSFQISLKESHWNPFTERTLTRDLGPFLLEKEDRWGRRANQSWQWLIWIPHLVSPGLAQQHLVWPIPGTSEADSITQWLQGTTNTPTLGQRKAGGREDARSHHHQGHFQWWPSGAMNSKGWPVQRWLPPLCKRPFLSSEQGRSNAACILPLASLQPCCSECRLYLDNKK